MPTITGERVGVVDETYRDAPHPGIRVEVLPTFPSVVLIQSYADPEPREHRIVLVSQHGIRELIALLQQARESLPL